MRKQYDNMISFATLKSDDAQTCSFSMAYLSIYPLFVNIPELTTYNFESMSICTTANFEHHKSLSMLFGAVSEAIGEKKKHVHQFECFE